MFVAVYMSVILIVAKHSIRAVFTHISEAQAGDLLLRHVFHHWKSDLFPVIFSNLFFLSCKRDISLFILCKLSYLYIYFTSSKLPHLIHSL